MDNVIKLIIQALRRLPSAAVLWSNLQTACVFSYSTNVCLPYGPIVRRLMSIMCVCV